MRNVPCEGSGACGANGNPRGHPKKRSAGPSPKNTASGLASHVKDPVPKSLKGSKMPGGPFKNPQGKGYPQKNVAVLIVLFLLVARFCSFLLGATKTVSLLLPY